MGAGGAFAQLVAESEKVSARDSAMVGHTSIIAGQHDGHDALGEVGV